MLNSRRKTTPQTTKRHEANKPTVAAANVGFVTQDGPLSLVAAPYRYEANIGTQDGRRYRIQADRQFERLADRRSAPRFTRTLSRKRPIPHRSADLAARVLPTYLRDPEVGA
jgi:hypothetical protein